ncbi:methyl-accepting chemotaxis protein [Marinilabiliaceae bacterium JC017]|nr:methyl-accepting chemotaxis protein [Marinilabiliaceae bacterium JC017]
MNFFKTHFRNNNLKSKLLVLIFGSMITISLLGTIINIWTSSNSTIEMSISYGKNAVDKAVEMVKTEMDEGLDEATGLASILSNNAKGHLHREEIISIIDDILAENKNFLGLYLVFEPNAFDDKDKEYINTRFSDETGRFIPYISRFAKETVKNYNKTNDYLIPKKTLKTYFSEPYNYNIDGKNYYMITVTIPIIKEGVFQGIVGIDIDTKVLAKIVDDIKIYNGHSISRLITDNYNIIGHSGHPESIGKKQDAIYRNKELFFNNNETIQWHDDDAGSIATTFSIGNTDKKWMYLTTVPASVVFKDLKRSILSTILITLLGILVMCTFIYWRLNTVIKPLITLSEKAKLITQGDLNVDFDIKRNDEIGQLANVFRDMTGRLKEIIYNVKTNANNLATASVQISSSAEQMSQGVNNQASLSEEISSSMEEMAGNIHESRNNARQSTQIAQSLKDTFKHNISQAEIANDLMHDIANKTNIINDMSFQTNLLSLNAAVEAARAGEAGRGFSVVAAEVKKLAEKSTLASTDIGETSNKGVENSNKSKESLENMLPEIAKTSDLIQEITAATEEQSIGADQINAALQQLNQINQENAAGSEELASSAEELSQSAEQLKELVSFFKIEEK